MKLKSFQIIFASLILLFSSCEEKKEIGTHNYANDETYTLTEGQIQNLTEEAKELESSIGSQIVVIIIDSLGKTTIEEYSLKIATDWGIGRKEYNDGVLITVSMYDRKMRIEVGTGLEKILKDEIDAQIIQEDMVHNFKKEKYYEGLLQAVQKIKILLKNNKELIGQRS